MITQTLASSLLNFGTNGLVESSEATKSINVANNENMQKTFSQVLKQSIDEVNSDQLQAYGAMNDIATGQVTNLQEAIQKIQEAELSLKLALEVKNKALGAYKQIMSMQI
jgi:flagellar hook-basal body complex protein FliE